MRPRLRAALVAAAIAASPAASLGAPAGSLAARLVGGSEERAIEHAFTAEPSHRHALIASIRASSVAPAWAVVRWVSPPTAGHATPGAARPALRSSFYHRVGDAERPGSPPGAARSDLERTFEVEVVYTGSGRESITYHGAYRSDCAGLGGFMDTENVMVSPMSWTVRYMVDLDDVLSAVRSAEGAVLVPGVAFDASGSRLDAVQRVSRTVVDAGCNGRPTNFECTTTFHLGGPDPGADLSVLPDGLQIGPPMTTATSGACSSADYTLGASLWDGGAAAALVPRLRLVGGTLPADPYAPVGVSWPGDSADQIEGFAASPCQGDQGSACADDFHWSGTVALRQLS
jgi:hypothetical protein